MKQIAAVVLFLVSMNASSQLLQEVPSANEVVKPALLAAGKEQKKILLLFHASWCGWCRKMDASLQAKTVKPLIDKFYITVHLTVYESKDKKHLENKGALEMITTFGGADQGLPYWYILDKEGKVIADSQYVPGKNTGCPATEEEVGYFISVLKKTSLLTVRELQTIKERFRQNEL